MTPENSLSRLAVASAIPSMIPSARGPAINTDARYSGISGYSISLALSLTKLIRPISQTVRGRFLMAWSMAFWLYEPHSILS